MGNEGQITGCSTCWKKTGKALCCEFQQGNYIVLYPGELEAAQDAGQSTTHLQITDDNYNGGKKAICTASCTANCDGGLKPLDCKSYPFFPVPFAGEVDLLVKGKKCPLPASGLDGHAQFVRETWEVLMREDGRVEPWLEKVELVGYTEPQPITLPIPKVA